jgi:hypothetical protein
MNAADMKAQAPALIVFLLRRIRSVLVIKDSSLKDFHVSSARSLRNKTIATNDIAVYILHKKLRIFRIHSHIVSDIASDL